MHVFINQVMSPPTKMFLLGPTFSTQAEVIAELAGRYNLVEVSCNEEEDKRRKLVFQISASATSSELSDKKTYPLFARTIESTSILTPAILSLLNRFNWRKVGKIITDSQLAIPAAAHVESGMDDFNITTVSSSTYNDDPLWQLQQLKSTGVKIMLSYTTQEQGLPRLWCRVLLLDIAVRTIKVTTMPSQSAEGSKPFLRMSYYKADRVYNQGFYGRRYQWIHWNRRHGIQASLSDDTFNYTNIDGCTLEQTKAAMEGVIVLGHMPVELMPSYNARGISGYTMEELQTMYAQYANEQEYATRGNHTLYELAFDSVWAAALAINKSLEDMPEGLSFENFTYEDRPLANHLFKSLLDVEFIGASGKVAFDEFGNRIDYVSIYQIRGGKMVILGAYDTYTDVIELYEGKDFHFIGDIPPSDSDVIVMKQIAIMPLLFYLMSILACVGILFCILCFVFNILLAENSHFHNSNSSLEMNLSVEVPVPTCINRSDRRCKFEAGVSVLNRQMRKFVHEHLKLSS
ncbi:hypothetical protein CAPTEDRAFT_200436 [Capitella teleta]|uniref:Receptor ligand binding region domain-containing protein n=1 Tax=Capitella teleta TaxID=283909 RepID=R7UEP3_CAPTE|nr:hypothetical protein CAPTEDRAFT_200436 [Capitella teleta]|eukprot:ELU05004.1 hypothetical protein CAPTEDRAFT_200436 [Capitella teleta]